MTVKFGFHDESEKKPSAVKVGIVKKKKKKIINQLQEAQDNRTFEGRIQVYLAEK